MAPYRRAYMFTGEPDSAENPADWLIALEANTYSTMTNREKVDLFASKLFRGSPAKKWFNKLPDEGHRRWHIIKQDFKSRWITPPPSVIAMLSPQPPAQLPAPSTPPDDDESFLTPPSSPTLPIHTIPSQETFLTEVADTQLSALSKLLAARDTPAVAKFCQSTANTEHHNFSLIWNLAFEAGRSFSQKDDAGNAAPAASHPTSHTNMTPLISSTIPISRSPPIPIFSVHVSSPLSQPLTPVPPNIPKPTAKFDWASEMIDFPTTSPLIPLAKPPRDLSCLRSSGKRPFSTLQFRNQRRYQPTRSHVPMSPSNLSQSRTENPSQYHPYLPHRRHSPPPSRTKPSNTTPTLSPALDWDRDPRLRDLSRVLHTLGWSHSSFRHIPSFR